MERSAQENQIVDLLAKVSKKDRASIQPEQDLVADLGLDSPKTLQLLAELEDTFQIEIDEGDEGRISKVRDLFAYIAAKKK